MRTEYDKLDWYLHVCIMAPKLAVQISHVLLSVVKASLVPWPYIKKYGSYDPYFLIFEPYFLILGQGTRLSQSMMLLHAVNFSFSLHSEKYKHTMSLVSIVVTWLRIRECPQNSGNPLWNSERTKNSNIFQESMVLLPGRIFSLIWALRKLRRWRPEIKNLI